jgi:hypothetical protein
VKSRIIETNGTSGLNFIVTNGLSSDELLLRELQNLKMMWKSSLRQ